MDHNTPLYATAGRAQHFGLNEQQAKVLEFVGENCVINAGAGTGKTKTLTATYIEALLGHKSAKGESLKPENIVAITYTNAAAEELRSRVGAGLVSLDYGDIADQMNDAWVMTINSFCNRVLRQERLWVAREYGIDTTFSIIDEFEAKALQLQVAKRIVSERYFAEQKEKPSGGRLFDAVDQAKVIDSLQTISNKARVLGIEPEDIILEEARLSEELAFKQSYEQVTTRFLKILQAFMEAYQRAKAELGVLDFTDQIHYVKRLFSENEKVRNKYAQQFEVILIDEFQDTNFGQFEIFKLIARDNIIVVGDKRQSIYAFQGATVEVFDEVLGKDAPSGVAKPFNEVKLSTNYRSHGDILTAVNKLFESEELFGNDFVRLEPKDNYQESHQLSAFGDVRAKFVGVKPKKANNSIIAPAAEVIADEFRSLHNNEQYRLSDMVVLAQTRSQLETCADILKSRGLSSIIVGGQEFLENRYVLGLSALLKVLDNPLDDVALKTASLSVFGRVNDEDLTQAGRRERAHRELYPQGPRLPLWHAFVQLAEEHPRSSVGRFVALINTALTHWTTEPLHAVARYLFGASGVAFYLEQKQGGEDGFVYEEAYASVRSLFNLLEKWQKKGMNNRSCLLRLQEAMENRERYDSLPTPVSFDESKQSPDAVRLMTIHKSKGLQFPVCAVIGQESSNPRRNGTFLFRVSVDAITGNNQMRVALGSYQLTEDEETQLSNLCVGRNVKRKEFGVDKNGVFTPASVEETKEAQKVVERDEGIRKYYVAMTRAEERLLYVYHGQTPQKHAGPLSATHSIAKSINDINIGDHIDWSFGGDPAQAKRPKFFEHCELEIQPKEESAPVIDSDMDFQQWEEARATLIEQFKGKAPLEPFAEVDAMPDDFVTWYAPCNQGATAHHLNEVTASGIEQYQACPRKYFYSGIMQIGLLSNTTSAMQRGTAMHTALEQAANVALIRKISSAEDVLGQKMGEKIQHLYDLSEKEAQGVLEAALRVVRTSWWRELDECIPLKTEAQFYERLSSAKGEDFFLHGYIDICGRRPDGSWLALDYKSGSKDATPEKFETQAKCYALVLMRWGAPSVDIYFVRPEAPAPEGSVDSIKFHFERDDRAEIESFLAQAKFLMEHSGALSIDDLQNVVSASECLSNCSYRGELCPGVKKLS